MNEIDKLLEAKYFYSQMVKEKENREGFKFNLSAFLSSSRSVLQYALKEAESKDDGKRWYDNQVTNNKVVDFLKDKRDFNIHTEPLEFKRDISLMLSETIHISDSVSMVHKDKDGNIKGQSIGKFQPFQSAIDNGIISSKYTFSDWQGDEDIFSICEEYLKELDKIVDDGRNKGFLT